ncbi:MAG: hypothetical protein Q8L64_04130 [bacterium]|nr:hypothetical protein [bacterium]
MKPTTLAFAIGAVALVLVIIGVAGFMSVRPDTDVPDQASADPGRYENATYGYSFAYPEGHEARAYTPDYVAVGRTTGGSFDSSADVTIVRGDIIESMLAMCAADGPNESMSCTSIRRQDPVETSTGFSGVRYFLNEAVTDTSTGITSVREKGPFFAFDISPNVPESARGYLVIHAPIASGASGTSQLDQNLISGIVDSLRVSRVENGL